MCHCLKLLKVCRGVKLVTDLTANRRTSAAWILAALLSSTLLLVPKQFFNFQRPSPVSLRASLGRSLPRTTRVEQTPRTPAGFVTYPSSLYRRNSVSGAPTTFQLRNSLEDALLATRLRRCCPQLLVAAQVSIPVDTHVC